MLKKLIVTLFVLTLTSQTFSNQENQAEIKQQEAVLLASLQNFNQEELIITKEYVKALRKAALYVGKYFSLSNGTKEDPNPDLVPLCIKADIAGLIIGTLKDSHDFIQNIHIQLCTLSSLVQNAPVYAYGLLPFDLERESLPYITSLTDLTEKMLQEIKKLKNN